MTTVQTICDECDQRVEVDSARFAIIREFGRDVACSNHNRRVSR